MNEQLMKLRKKASLLRSRLSGCHATLPQKELLGKRCVTSRKTAAKETKRSQA